MRKLFFAPILFFVASCLYAQSSVPGVNAVIGDESFVQNYGVQPGESISELQRIQIHLAYVEKKLRTADVSRLSKTQRQKRTMVLRLLHQYWMQGVFPANHDFPGERKPCFIDKEGNICAVGFLIAETAGLKTAEEINRKHQYDFLMDMKEVLVDTWAKEQGLSLEECALIQPTYGYIPTERTTNVPIKTAYGISSGFLGGANIGISVINFSNANSGSKHLSHLAIATGTAQIVLGLVNIQKDGLNFPVDSYSERISYKAQRNLSYINIASGTATLVSSVINLSLNNQSKDIRNAINLYSYPGTNEKLNLGISFSRSL